METDKVRLRTYKQVWSQERVIYQIERVRLPFPVTFRQAGVFAAAIAAMVPISAIPGVSASSPVLRYLLIPAVAAWYLTQQRLDGKSPLRWLSSMIRYWLAPKQLNRLQPMPQTPERLRFGGVAGGRRLKG